MAERSLQDNSQQTSHWLRIGVIFAWLMCVGGLLAMFVAPAQVRVTFLPMVVAGSLLNAVCLRLLQKQRKAGEAH